MPMTDDGAVIQTFYGTIAELGAAGSPVVGQNEAARYRVAQCALRRWQSFLRRYPKPSDEMVLRVGGLAKGLRDAREAERDAWGAPLQPSVMRHHPSVALASFARAGTVDAAVAPHGCELFICSLVTRTVLPCSDPFW